MLTSFMPSSCMASRAMVMFSRAWGWDWGRLLCRSFRFCNVSTRATNLKHRRDVMRNRIVKLRCDEKVHKTVMESITWVVNKPYTGTQPLVYDEDWQKGFLSCWGSHSGRLESIVTEWNGFDDGASCDLWKCDRYSASPIEHTVQ